MQIWMFLGSALDGVMGYVLRRGLSRTGLDRDDAALQSRTLGWCPQQDSNLRRPP
jgi:hypothetical protein